MTTASHGERHYSTLVVQPWGEPGNYWQATIVRVCPTVAEAFRYVDFVELTLARHNLPARHAQRSDRGGYGAPASHRAAQSIAHGYERK